jgi:DNA-binding transcriptional MerR regulator
LKEYPTKDIAEIVGISAQKVRSYAQALEKAGYAITRNDRGFRIFTDKDIPLFQEMKKQSSETGMNAGDIVLTLLKDQNNHSDPGCSEEVTTIQNETTNTDLPQIEDERYKHLLEEINSLKQLIEKQQKYIDDRIEQQRDLKYIELLRKSQEVKKADLELAAAQEKEKKKGFFSKFFNM